ncbi:MAG: peroxiredoxin [Alphaproteobacteria bacterium]|nr:peroxiredoxin [Alphaproteobacteria bacterium]OJV46961.1 MAG: peroxiredoxin [Alphaproteobacteria bacterium 43-37]
MTIKIGDTLPNTTLKIMVNNTPKDISTKEFFANRTVALFAVPGAYTPTCTAKHLPGYVDAFSTLKGKGVEEVACVAVNDIFVMDAWGKSCSAENVTMLSDGNAEFTKSLGLEMEAQGYGMGTRSQRYSMLVKNGVVEKLFVENPGTFEVSSAEYLLDQIS